MKGFISHSLRLFGLAMIPVGFAVSPVLAQTASVSGAVTYTTPAGYSTSISAQQVAPVGFSFGSSLSVSTIAGAGGAPQGILLQSGTLTPVVNAASTVRLTDSVIQKLGGIDTATQTGLDSYTAILKAAAGANGLE